MLAAAAPSEANGLYSQYLVPGTTCVWIDATEAGNSSLLGRGRWTYPPGGYDAPARHTLTVDWGDEVTDLDFGWDSLP